MIKIETITGREIFSAVGRPTVEATVVLTNGIRASASVPSGTSTGKYEARELRDGGNRFQGLGVRKAVEKICLEISPVLCGISVDDQREIDRVLVELDGTPDKRRLGGNSILAVSLAVARTAALVNRQPIYRRIGGKHAHRIPMPLSTIISGGRHAASNLAFEDYMLVFDRFSEFSDAAAALMEIRYHLEDQLKARFAYIAEKGGAFSPPIESSEEAFDFILEAIEKAGFSNSVGIGLDVVGSDLFDKKKNRYRLNEIEMNADALAEHYEDLAHRYPIRLIEDPFHEDDFESFAALKKRLPDILIVGDDLFVSHPERIRKGISSKAANALLLKVNQVGTLTEAIDAAFLALQHGYEVIVSSRSADTTDDFISDLSVGIGARWIKIGSPVRGERSTKFNRLLEIEQELFSFSTDKNCR